MYIEDMIHRLASSGTYIFSRAINMWVQDARLISSFSDQLMRGSAFTEKQANMAVKFCQKYKTQLEVALAVDLTVALSSPKFRLPIRTLEQYTKNVSLLDRTPKKIKLTFKYDEDLITLIRKWKGANPGNTADWDSESKSWHLSLTEGNILFVKNELVPRGFNVEPEILEFIEKIDEILENFETHVPMAVLEENKVVYKNVHGTVEQPDSGNIVESLFRARDYAISTWDDNLENYVNSKTIPLTSKFLKTKLGEKIEVNASETDIAQFSDIVRYAKNLLIIIPGVNELYHLKKWHDFLLTEGFSVNSMSVLFRLENSTQQEFNNFVKDNQLNRPMNSDTKVFFVSQKLPKPLIKNHSNFGVVIDLGTGHSPHYSIQNILVDHHDVITYNKKK